mmetsp:Transcript_52329/g.94179  ORF Transcript_52329/g.94179 Transcript_52329/m.94179 type:complete len:113 (+) Transcript_52329:428-766(+)
MSCGTVILTWLPEPCVAASPAEATEDKEAVMEDAEASPEAASEGVEAIVDDKPVVGKCLCSSGCTSHFRPIEAKWFEPKEAASVSKLERPRCRPPEERSPDPELQLDILVFR